MKRIAWLICLIILVLNAPTWATTYYVANAGNNSCNGTAPVIGSSGACAWKTIAKVNASTFSAGDSILFNRGDTWREQLTVSSSGSSGSPITFGAYGSGALPIISGANVITGWIIYPEAQNTYYTALATQPTVVSYNGTVLTKNSGGYRNLSSGQWYYSNGSLYINLGGNPSSGPVEASQRTSSINFNSNSYIILNGLSLTGASTYSAQISTSGGNNTIQNCTIYNAYEGIWITSKGGSDSILNNTIHDLNDYGVMIHTPSAAGYLVQGNTMYNIGTPQIGDNTDMQGIYIEAAGGTLEHNIIHNGGNNAASGFGSHEHCIYYKGSGITIRYNWVHDWSGSGIKTGGATNCKIYYNVIYNNAYVGLDVDNQGSPAYLNFYNNTVYNNGTGTYGSGGFYQDAGSDHITLMNNIFLNNISTGSNATLQINFNTTGTTTNFVSDCNLLYYLGATNIASAPNGGTAYKWSGWNALGYDTHGVNANPLVVSTSTPDFHLQSTSPAINSGINVGLTQDYEGNPVSQGLAPNIGAYQLRLPAPPIFLY